MNWSSTVRCLQYVVLVLYTTTNQHLVNAGSSLENHKGNDRSSDFVFKFLPTPEEGKSATPIQRTTTTDSLPDDEYTTYSDNWVDVTTDAESDETTVASHVDDSSTPRLYEIKSTSANPTLTHNMSQNVGATPTEPQRLPTKPRIVFNIIRATSTVRTKLLTKNPLVTSSTIKVTENISRHPPSTRKGSVVTTSERLRADVGQGLRPENKRHPSTDDGDDEEEEIYIESTTFHDYELYEHTTDGNVTETPGVLLGFWPLHWNNWYWIPIALVIFIIVVLIPGFFCQVCLAKRREAKRATQDSEKAEDEDGSASVSGSFASRDNSTQDANPSTKPSLSKEGQESDQSQRTNADLPSSSSSQDKPVVINIPDPTQIPIAPPANNDEPNKHDNAAIKRKAERPLSEKYDVRVEIGNETIIKSTDVTQQSVDQARKRDRTANGKSRTDARKRQQRPRREKQRNEASKRKEVRHNRDKKIPRGELSRKKPTHPSRKLHRRRDTKSKISDSTKSILEAARDLDGILAAITSLTHEYPIPGYPKTHKSKPTNEKTHESKPRRRQVKSTTHPDKNNRSKRMKSRERDRDSRGKKLQNIDERNVKSSRPNKKQKKSKEKFKTTDEKTRSEKKVPTLVKEDLPAVDATKNEQRRRRLERDLKKLQNYHNTQFSNA